MQMLGNGLYENSKFSHLVLRAESIKLGQFGKAVQCVTIFFQVLRKFPIQNHSDRMMGRPKILSKLWTSGLSEKFITVISQILK